MNAEACREVAFEIAVARCLSRLECARVRLICTLHYDLEIDAENLPVVLSLVDQLYDTRQRLLSLTAAIASQDPTIQTAIMAAMQATRPPSHGDSE